MEMMWQQKRFDEKFTVNLMVETVERNQAAIKGRGAADVNLAHLRFCVIPKYLGQCNVTWIRCVEVIG
ncbi:MAG: hypothetical protein GY696_15530 [Gammaproteobacteria bacterium]|nr:hypothetical protein [Gammaproteobacteria bacterium]